MIWFPFENQEHYWLSTSSCKWFQHYWGWTLFYHVYDGTSCLKYPLSTCYKRENSFTLIVSPASLNWLLITTWFINGDSINEGNFLLEYERQTFPRATGIFMEKSTHVREKYSPSTVFMFELIKSTTRVSKSLYISIWFPTHQKTQI